MYSRKRIKTVCLLVVMLFVIAIQLTGCGSTVSPTTTATQSTVTATATLAPTPEPLKPVTLTYLMPPPNADESNKDSVLEAVNKMLQDKISATLDIQFVDWASYQSKINIMSASGEAFDLFSSVGYLGFGATVAKGGVLPLDDLINQYAPTVTKMTDAKYWPAVTIGGKKFAIINVMPFATQLGCTYQKELVDKYSFDVTAVKTLKDIEPFLANIKKNEPNIIPLLSGNLLNNVGYGDRYDSIIGAQGGDGIISYDTQTNTLVGHFENTVTIDRAKTMKDWYDKGYLAKDAALKKDAVAEIKTKKYAVFQCSGSTTDDGVKSTSAFGFPCVDTVDGSALISTASVQTALTYISKTSKNPERTMMFIDALWSDKKLFNTLCYGLEGQDYDVVSGAGTDNPTVKTKDPMKWIIWHPWIGEMNQNQWPSNLNDQKALDGFIKANESGKTSSILGFVFDPTNVKNEVTKLAAIYDEDKILLYTGSVKDVDAFIAGEKVKFDKAGYATVLAEVQKQLDAWKAANGK